MRTSKWVVPVLFAGLTVTAGHAHIPQLPAAIATFYGIGDLPGGPIISTVRDATRHNGVLYAVGASTTVNQPTLNTNAPLLWTWDGTTALLTALPETATSSSASQAIAAAITPDAAFIASAVHTLFNTPALHAVRVTRAALPSGSANVDLNASPYPAYTFTNLINGVVQTTATTSAGAISTDGSILYGNATLGDTTVNPRTDVQRAIRFDINNQTSALIPVLALAGHVGNAPASRGTSSDGSVMVGQSTGAAGSGIIRAFRYVHGTGVAAIPLLPGGTTNRALAVSPDGNLTLASGASTFLPRGEVYIHNATTDAVTRLGSANTPWQPAGNGGMTADGSVVGMAFVAPLIPCAPTPCTSPTQSRNSYIRNANGWFHFTNVLTEAGVDISQNWDSLQINGVSPDGTIVFGQGRHNDELEGFVAEFPAGYLAAFDMPAAPPANTTIVGVWRLGVPGTTPATGDDIIALLADGTYFHLATNVAAADHDGFNGFERGRYFWNPATGAFNIATLQDTNGDVGLSDLSGQGNFVATVVADSLTVSVTGCVPDAEVPNCSLTATRVTGAAGSVVGGWIIGNAAIDNSSRLVILLGNGEYYLAEDGDSELPNGNPNGVDGIEQGTWAWNAGTGDFSATTLVDTNGQWGLSHPNGFTTVVLSADELQLSVTDGDGTDTGILIVNPATVVPVVTVNPSTVNGAIGTAFNYAIAATRALTYGATSLPPGLSLDPTTGAISGTPTTTGTFTVTLSATNTFGATGAGILTVVVPSPGTTVEVNSAKLWIGIKNSNDAGTKLDLLVEVLKNGSVVGTGLNTVPGGNSGFNSAVLRTISVAMGSTTYATGDVLGVRLSVRIAAASNQRAGTARLWFGDAAADSRIKTVTNGAPKAFYLANGFVFGLVPGPGPKTTVDVKVDRAVGGNAYKAFGTWTKTF